MNIQYNGAKWFKCDLHLHTPASQCFTDKTVTAEQWVQVAIEAGLQCVAVTDHNSGGLIDEIKTAAIGTGLVVFPGVEITCDTSKIHLLILFDLEKTKQDVEDFLLVCGITREMFAKAEAHSQKTVIEIATLANEKGALVIPAHIDEFNGLGYCASVASVKEFLNLPFIHAVQFVHQEFLMPSLKVKDNQELVNTINAYYNNPPVAIGADRIKAAYDGMTVARMNNKKLLAFSDNPDVADSAKHGLAGIGKHYTWIKMDGKPTLESLRQALMMPERTVHCFKSLVPPYKTPSLWIHRITVQNTSLTKKENVFSMDFNPQLTTIIGGRGSGKSSILRFLRGVFERENDLKELSDILEDHKEFFKLIDTEDRGVLTKDTRIEVYFVRDELEYRIVYAYSNNPRTTVERLNVETTEYEQVDDEGFIDFFRFEQYSQKQIFSIAQKPNSLRNRIDNAISEVEEMTAVCKQLREDYQSLMANKRALQQAVLAKGKLNTEIKDLESKILLLKQSGISDIITQQQNFIRQKHLVRLYLDTVNDTIGRLQSILPSFNDFQPFNVSTLDEKYRNEMGLVLKASAELVTQTGEMLTTKSIELTSLLHKTREDLKATSLFSSAEVSEQLFALKKKELEEKGITDMSDFEKFTKLIAEKKEELKNIAQKEAELQSMDERIHTIFTEFMQNRTKLTSMRTEFVSTRINSDKIRISIKPYADQTDFEQKFRRIIQKAGSYERGMDAAINAVYSNRNILDGLADFKKTLHEIHDDVYTGETYDGRFTRMIQDLNSTQLDEIDLLYPEDEIEMKYKNRDGNFKPLAVASAGQKTTAVLTFILSFGNSPLILDQPEDDLDNRLVYDLIVDKIRCIKELRQVIVVTHNANIPVNGDAEYVISMSSDTHNLKIQTQGTVEKNEVKNEICEIMEGGVEAFKTRANRYASLNGK